MDPDFDPLTLVLNCDDAYAMPLATTLRSVVEAMPGAWPIDVRVMTNRFSAAHRQRVLESLPAGSVDLRWLSVDLERFESTSTVAHISRVACARLLTADVLEASLERVLYLDADVLVTGSLLPLWRTPLHGAVLGAVVDDIDDGLQRSADELREVPRVHRYFNSGVLLIDLRRWRDEGLSAKALRYLQAHPDSPFPDQDALNVACDGRWTALDERWNFMQHRTIAWESIAVPERPAVVHFVTANKPWRAASRSAWAATYDAVRSRTRYARSSAQRLKDALIVIGCRLKHRLMKPHEVRAAAAPRPLRVCMLAYSFYENDGRVMRYAEALAQDGAEVDAIALRREGQPREEWLHGVRVIRIQRREKNERGRWAYLRRVSQFLVHSMFELGRRHLNRPYDLVHVHSVPDFEVFAAWIPKLGGARVILDIHDIVPEFYAAKFGVAKESLTFRSLQRMERWSASFADHVIVANDLWLEKIVQRATQREKCSSFINYPDLTVFHPRLRSRGVDGRFVLSYPGTLNWHQGLDIAIRAFALAHREAPAMEFHIHGEGSARDGLRQLIDELGLQRSVHLHPPLPLRDIALVMADADLGVVPKRNDAFGGDAFSTKVMEFMALGVPLVVAGTRVDRHYFDDSMLRFFTPGDAQDLARVMLEAYGQRERGAELAARATEHVSHNHWGVRKTAYLELVQGLLHAPA